MQSSLASIIRSAATLGLAASSELSGAPAMFDEASFSRLDFLEGRWNRIGPDGKAFFDAYVLATPTLLRSIRHADATFSEATDGSTVTLVEGAITSTWGGFTWKATSVSASRACFEPVSAPSAFCRERVAHDSVTVSQRWKDAAGQEQSYVLTLRRVTP